MDIQGSFDTLSRVVEQYESRGVSVQGVAAEADGGTLHVTVEVAVAMCAATGDGAGPALAPESAHVTDDGLRVEFAVPEIASLPPDVTAVATDRRVERVAEDGDVHLTVDHRIDIGAEDDTRAAAGGRADRGTPGSPGENDAGTAAGGDRRETAGDDRPTANAGAPEGGPEAVRDPDVPAYDDTEYLRALYETCDTFDEMSEEIAMDVAGETVRRYMIEAGIHDPKSYSTASGEGTDADAARRGDGADSADGSGANSASESDRGAGEAGTASSRPPATDDRTIPDEQVVTDGVGLPEELTVEEVVEAVVDAKAFYEVQRRLDLERQRTRQLLRQLNLLDLVVHRIDEPERTVSAEDVLDRMRQGATGA